MEIIKQQNMYFITIQNLIFSAFDALSNLLNNNDDEVDGEDHVKVAHVVGVERKTLSSFKFVKSFANV